MCISKMNTVTVYPKKYAHGFCFAVLCCGYTLTDCPTSIRLTSLALWQSNDCPSASKATLMNMDKYYMWIHYERLNNHSKAKHNKTMCIFLGKYCITTLLPTDPNHLYHYIMISNPLSIHKRQAVNIRTHLAPIDNTIARISPSTAPITSVLMHKSSDTKMKGNMKSTKMDWAWLRCEGWGYCITMEII